MFKALHDKLDRILRRMDVYYTDSTAGQERVALVAAETALRRAGRGTQGNDTCPDMPAQSWPRPSNVPSETSYPYELERLYSEALGRHYRRGTEAGGRTPQEVGLVDSGNGTRNYIHATPDQPAGYTDYGQAQQALGGVSANVQYANTVHASSGRAGNGYPQPPVQSGLSSLIPTMLAMQDTRRSWVELEVDEL